jgi:hypothetical protein
MLEATLPEDPKDKETYTVPEGQIAGASYVLHLKKDGEEIGTAEQLDRVANVSGKATLSRTSSFQELKKGDTLETVFKRYDYKSVIFVDYFGWMGYECYKKVETMECNMWKVLAVLTVGPQSQGKYFYEKLCLARET